MPQMAPMWWTTIMIFTILCLITLMVNNYFLYKMNMNVKNEVYKNHMNWKW